MNMKKAITGLMSVAALTMVTAGASFAQTFATRPSSRRTRSPSSGGIGNYITATNGANGAVDAAGIGSDVRPHELRGDQQRSQPPSGVRTSAEPFTIALSVTPVGGTTQTQDFTGTISGTVLRRHQPVAHRDGVQRADER